MGCFVVLLRGINVSGHRKVPMAELRALCVEQGYGNPQTYIASGNLLINAETDAAEIGGQLGAAIESRFGFRVDLIVRSAPDWRAYRDGNPFPDGASKQVHLCLTTLPPAPDAIERIAERLLSAERVARVGDAIWIDYGAGVADTKLTPAFLDKAAGSALTGRNANTVATLQTMIEARR